MKSTKCLSKHRQQHSLLRWLVAGLGFVEVGSQWDEDDGEETIFERDAGPLCWELTPAQQRQFGTGWRPCR